MCSPVVLTIFMLCYWSLGLFYFIKLRAYCTTSHFLPFIYLFLKVTFKKSDNKQSIKMSSHMKWMIVIKEQFPISHASAACLHLCRQWPSTLFLLFLSKVISQFLFKVVESIFLLKTMSTAFTIHWDGVLC